MKINTTEMPSEEEFQADFPGYVDVIEPGLINGWIRKAGTSDPVSVSVWLNGVLIAPQVCACLYREDLARASVGSGHHALMVTFDPHDTAFTGDFLRIELRDPVSGAIFLTQTTRSRPLPGAYEAPRAYGCVDRCDLSGISGWIKHKNSAAAVTVDVVADGKVIAQNVAANSFRYDLKQAGIGDGCHAFQVPFNITDADPDHEFVVELRESGTGATLLQRAVHPQSSRPAHTEPVPAQKTAAVAVPAAGAAKAMKCEIRLELAQDNRIKGWAVDTNAPGRIFDVEILLDGFSTGKTRNDRPRSDLAKLGRSTGAGGFQKEFLFTSLDAGEYEIVCRAPDGSTASRTITIAETAAPRLPVMGEMANAARIAVVIPVYNAAEDLVVCIDRLAAYTPHTVDILFIDDCSPDPEIARILSTVSSRHPGMRALRNETNLGFSGTINRGVRETGSADVIMLNSDARVTPKWSEGLWYAAYSQPRIGTATAMSDRAGAFSAPTMGNDNPLPPGTDEVSFGRAFRRAGRGLYPRVPTGNGFCLYVRRACLDEVGLLDHVAFPKGYGEENDFCMRAMRAGWTHVIDDRTYVFHDRSKSFGSSKTDLMSAGRAIVDERYPEYSSAISVFRNDAMISSARMGAYRAARGLLAGKGLETRVLFVIATQTGGTPQTNADLMRAFDGNIEGWTLRCNSRMLELCRLAGDSYTVVARHTLQEPVDPVTHHSNEYDQVVQYWLFAYDFDLVHIRHLAWHSLSLPAVAKRLHLPVVFSFHDFYMLSPTIKMLDDEGVYLGDSFSAAGRERRESLWPVGSQPDPTGAWLQFWQKRSAEALSHCDAFITTSESARQLILQHLPGIPPERFLVIPHGRDFEKFQSLCEPWTEQTGPLRILLPGNINEAKGLNVILQLLDHDTAGRFEFHVLGNVRSHKPHPRLIIHGAYQRDEFADRVAKLKVNAGAVFSIWDETYCHTLTEMWSVGIPALVFDFANVASRVRDSGAGWVVDHRDIPALYDAILNRLCNPAEQEEKHTAVINWQKGYGRAYGTRIMASYYLAVYRDVMRDPARVPGTGTRARVAVVCPADPSQSRAPGSTKIRIWERCRNSIDRDITFIRMAPDALIPAVEHGLIDAAIIQRTAIEKSLVGPTLDTLAQNGISYLYDIDDDLLNVPAEKDPKGTYAGYAPALRDILASAKVVTVSTQPLKETMERYARTVKLLPNRLSDRLWTRIPATLRKPDGIIHALYMGTRTHDEDLRMILPSLDDVARHDRRFRCTLIGITTGSELLRGRESWLKVVSIPTDAKEYEAFVPWLLNQAHRYDFGLAPLMNTPFNSTKSSLKLLDYSGMGLPVLASDVDVYRRDAQKAPHVTLVKNTIDAWTSALLNAVSQAPRSDETDAAQHDWVASHAMLRDTLAEYDQMVLNAVTE